MTKKNRAFFLAALSYFIFNTQCAERSIQDVINQGGFDQYVYKQTLDLQRLKINSIEGIDKVPNKEQFTTLILRRNQLSGNDLVQKISEALPQLQSLNLSLNPNIENIDPHIFEKLPKLSKLYATNTNIKNIDNHLFASVIARKKRRLSELCLFSTPFFKTYEEEFKQNMQEGRQAHYYGLTSKNIESFLVLKKAKDALSSQHSSSSTGSTTENLMRLPQNIQPTYLTGVARPYLASAARENHSDSNTAIVVGATKAHEVIIIDDGNDTIIIDNESEKAHKAAMANPEQKEAYRDSSIEEEEEEAANILAEMKTAAHPQATPQPTITKTAKPLHFNSEAFNQRKYQFHQYSQQQESAAIPAGKRRKVAEQEEAINLDKNEYTINLDEDSDYTTTNNEPKGKGKGKLRHY